MAILNRERASTILAEANCGSVKEVAARWSVSTETIRNYRKLEQEDEAFAAAVARKTQYLASEWRDVAIQFLRTGLRKLENLVTEAKSEPQQIRAVAGAIKVVGELQIVKAALSGQHTFGSGEGPAPTKAPGSERDTGQGEVH